MEFKRVYKYLIGLSAGALLVACSPDNGAVDEAEAPTEEVTDETAAEETTPKDEKMDVLWEIQGFFFLSFLTFFLENERIQVLTSPKRTETKSPKRHHVLQ